MITRRGRRDDYGKGDVGMTDILLATSKQKSLCVILLLCQAVH